VRTIPTIHAFGPFRLDADAEILFRGSDPLPVGKRAVALLRVLVERAGARRSLRTQTVCRTAEHFSVVPENETAHVVPCGTGLP